MKINWKQFFCLHWFYGKNKVSWNRANCSPWGYDLTCRNCDKTTYSGIK